MTEGAAAAGPAAHFCADTEEQLHGFWRACGLPERAWPGAIGLYRKYWHLIGARNAAAGLMGNVSGEDFCLKHVADSLAVLPAWPELLAGSRRLADVGCGAGLPGIVLAVALPHLHLTAIESDRKKAAFVAAAVEELGLAGRAEVVPRRGRELGHDERFRGRFDTVTARAVAPADKLIRDCRLLIAPGGSALLYKTPAGVAGELAGCRREARKHKLTVQTSAVIDLPGGAGRRQFLRVRAL